MFFTQRIYYNKSWLLWILLFTATFTYSQPRNGCYADDPKAGARENNYDTRHIALELSFEPEKGKVIGKVTHTLYMVRQYTDSLFLDAPGIKIHRVLLNNSPVQYSQNAEGVIIKTEMPLHLHTAYQLTIEYEAQPRKGIYFIGWNDTTGLARKQIWTQGQGTDNRYWIPCFDDMNDKATTEVKILFNKEYRVLSNGLLTAEKILKDGNKLWHYKMLHPHSPYLIMLAIGNYATEKRRSKSGVPIELWYYPENPERVEPTYRYTVEMMNWMEKEFGVAYPWEKYAQVPVQDFIYGAMENTTATVFGDFYFIDDRAFLDRNYISTNAHELAHQWFGNYVTARAPEHIWLQESFATHYQKHFERSIFGEDHFQWNRRLELQGVLSAAKRNNNPIVHTGAGTERIYQKGSLVLDMLRYLLKDDEYNRALYHYLKQHAYKNVDTHDFYIAFLETLGVNLDWFFNQWLYRGGEPAYAVNFEELSSPSGPFSRFTVQQVHETSDLIGLFKMPIWFEVHYADDSYDRRQVWISEQTHVVDIPNPEGKKVAFALFDPNAQIIKTVDFPKDLQMLKTQASKAPNMIDRYDALTALAGFSFDDKKSYLSELFAREPFYANRIEIVRQVVSQITETDYPLIQKMLHDPHAKVRLAVIQNASFIPAELLSDFEKLLSDSSYWIVEKALERLCEVFPENKEKYLALTEEVTGMHQSIRIKWLEIACTLSREKYLPALIAFTGPAYEFRTRINAMEALKRLNYLDESLVAHLFDAVLSANNRLAGPAKSLVKHFATQIEYKNIIKDYYNKMQWESWQDEILRDLF